MNKKNQAVVKGDKDFFYISRTQKKKKVTMIIKSNAIIKPTNIEKTI